VDFPGAALHPNLHAHRSTARNPHAATFGPPNVTHLPDLTARRYLQPLREGGSLPAVVETERGLYVVKFRGAGQGPRALIAELVVGGIARELGLPVPELAVVRVPPALGADEPDPEIRDLLVASHGVNVGMRYLDGAFNYDGGAAGNLIDGAFASDVVWLDAYVTNPDRTARNPNLMVWQRRPWLIDHGSALYAHHAWARVTRERQQTAFPLIRDHVLLAAAEDLAAADARLASRLTRERLTAVADAVPDALLMDPYARGDFDSAAEARARYVDYLEDRVTGPRAFVTEAVKARVQRLAEPPRRLEVRR
jgi:hypothetical protein